ncbi:MAG: hypothetical protein IT529_15520 [Burkholderiales bacterium]|nr:hypothetical protein [Burkholderiales bacterium]
MLIRRSNLLVPVADAKALRSAWRHGADAITLDLEDARGSAARRVRGRVRDAIPRAARGAAEVFVRVNRASLAEDFAASIWPGLTGIVLPGIESAAELARAAGLATAFEAERGIPAGSLRFIVLLESARAVWDIRAIITASARVEQAGLHEARLARGLGITAAMRLDPGYDPFVYARGRLAFEATAAKVSPVGMSWPLAVGTGEAAAAEVHAAATKARNSGMKGAICPHPSWVAPVNAAFTPTPELVGWNRRVREAFAAGVAAGTAAVPLEGRMIDVPVDEWAIVVLATAEACAARDAQKRAALAAASGGR